jgi:hypothetical protein
MTRRVLDIEQRITDSPRTDNQADLRYLLDRLSAQDRIIGSLAPAQWLSIASRVPPGHRDERAALTDIARLAEQVRKEG